MNTTSSHQSTLIREVNPSFRHKVRRIISQENFKRNHEEKFELLTTREREIVFLLAHDLNNPQIAERLFISRYTVEQHRKNIYRKLEISSNLQLFQYALAFNLI